jgi:hypothetical protein
VNVVRLVVQQQRGRVAGAQHDVRLGYFDRKVQRLVVPVGVRERREILRAGVGLFAPAVLILVIEG